MTTFDALVSMSQMMLRARGEWQMGDGFDLHLGIAFCFSESILNLGDGFLGPVEIDCSGKALLEKRQQIAQSSDHLGIDTAQSGVLFCYLRRITL